VVQDGEGDDAEEHPLAEGELPPRGGAGGVAAVELLRE